MFRCACNFTDAVCSYIRTGSLKMCTPVQMVYEVILVRFLTYGYAGTGVICSYIGRDCWRMGTVVIVIHVVILIGALGVWVRWYRCYM